MKCWNANVIRGTCDLNTDMCGSTRWSWENTILIAHSKAHHMYWRQIFSSSNCDVTNWNERETNCFCGWVQLSSPSLSPLSGPKTWIYPLPEPALLPSFSFSMLLFPSNSIASQQWFSRGFPFHSSGQQTDCTYTTVSVGRPTLHELHYGAMEQRCHSA